MKPDGRVLAALALGAVVVGGLVVSQSRLLSIAEIERLVVAAEATGPLGWICFAAVQTGVAMLGIVPASLLGVGAGLAYGILLGFLLSATGTLLGGWLAFELSRSLCRPWIVHLLEKRRRATRLDEAIARDGWKFICLLRMSPVMPFAATSYALGLTKVGRGQYLLGTLASLPALLGYVVVGALTSQGLSARQSDAGPLRLLLLVAGIAATGLVTLRIGRMLAATGLLPEAGDLVRKR